MFIMGTEFFLHSLFELFKKEVVAKTTYTIKYSVFCTKQRNIYYVQFFFVNFSMKDFVFLNLEQLLAKPLHL